MTVQLYPYCPALVRMRYRPSRGDHRQLFEKALGLVKANPAVVITGSNQEGFSYNCRTGKTKLARAVCDALFAEGQSGRWINIADELGINTRLPYWADDRYDDPAPRSFPLQFCVLDEAHHAFPNKLDKYIPHREEFHRQTTNFLEKLAKMTDAGTRLIFITSAHPFAEIYRSRLVSQELLGFLTAPILEFNARKSLYF